MNPLADLRVQVFRTRSQMLCSTEFEFYQGYDDLPPEHVVFGNRSVALREYVPPICRIWNYIDLPYSPTYLRMVLLQRYLPH